MDPEAARRLEEQIWELWVEPEIRRRSGQSDLPPRFKLRAFQILFASPSDGGSTTVRLNEEVRAMARIPPRQAIRPGDSVYAHDIEAIEEITLLDEEANRAHITGLDLGGKWVTYLDLRYDRKRAVEHLEAAGDFLDAAYTEQQKGRWRPFIENLFTAAELAAKAELMLTPTGSPKELRDHNKIRGKYVSWARLENAPGPSSQALAELGKLRYPARYLSKPLRFDPQRADTLLAEVRAALEWTRRRLIGGEPERQRAE